MNLEPKKVFDYFEKLSGIPRESGNEKAVSDFLKNLEKRLAMKFFKMIL